MPNAVDNTTPLSPPPRSKTVLPNTISPPRPVNPRAELGPLSTFHPPPFHPNAYNPFMYPHHHHHWPNPYHNPTSISRNAISEDDTDPHQPNWRYPTVYNPFMYPPPPTYPPHPYHPTSNGYHFIPPDIPQRARHTITPQSPTSGGFESSSHIRTDTHNPSIATSSTSVQSLVPTPKPAAPVKPVVAQVIKPTASTSTNPQVMAPSLNNPDPVITPVKDPNPDVEDDHQDLVDVLDLQAERDDDWPPIGMFFSPVYSMFYD